MKRFGAGSEPSQPARVTAERAQVLAEEAADLAAVKDCAAACELYVECQRIYRKLSRSAEEAEVLVAMARCCEQLADHKSARAHFEEAVALLRGANLKRELADVLLTFGSFTLERGNFTYSNSLLNECVELCEKEAFREPHSTGLYLLAAARLADGDSAGSAEAADRAARSHGYVGESLNVAAAILKLAQTNARLGHLARAHALFEESVREYRSSGYLGALAPAMLKTGVRAVLDGRKEALLHLFDAVQSLYAAGRTRHGQPEALREIGNQALKLGDTVSAFSLGKESMAAPSIGALGWKDRAGSYLLLGCVASREEHDDLARSMFEKCFAAINEAGRPEERMDATLRACRRILYAEDLNAAALYFARCAAYARSLGAITQYSQAMYYRGCIANLQSDYSTASRHLEECLIYYGEAGPVKRYGRALIEKGVALRALGDEDLAKSCMERGLATARSESDSPGAAAALAAMGSWFTAESDGEPERRLLLACIAESAGHEERYLHRGVPSLLADIERRAGSVDLACRLYLKSILLLPQEGRLLACATALEGMTLVAADSGLHLASARLLGRAASIRRRTGTRCPTWNQEHLEAAAEAAKSRLGAEEFAAAGEAAAGFTAPDVVREAWSVVEARAM